MICVGGAVPHSYLFVVFLGQLELCPLAFQGAWCSEPSLRSLLAACRIEGITWLDLQCGEWAADACSCAPRSHLQPQPIFPVFVK